MAKERILITVKTYPTLSKKYGETVCTAGIREDGSWVRLYPVPFRRLDETEQYRKFDWIELNLIRQTSDCRPESHRPYDPKAMPVVGHIGTGDQWRERRRHHFRSQPRWYNNPAKGWSRVAPLRLALEQCEKCRERGKTLGTRGSAPAFLLVEASAEHRGPGNFAPGVTPLSGSVAEFFSVGRVTSPAMAGGVTGPTV